MGILSGILEPLGIGKKSRSDERRNEEREARIRDATRAVGMDELGRYENPTLTAGQEERLSNYAADMKTKTESLHDYAKDRNSEMELASMREWSDMVKGIRFDMEQTTSEESWAKAIQSLGMSQDAAREIARMHTEDRKEKIGLFSGLIGAVAKTVTLGALSSKGNSGSSQKG